MVKENKLDAANRLREIRLNMGVSQEKFAEYLDISLSAYKKIESAENGISVRILRILKEQFNISSDYLLYGDYKGFNDVITLIDNYGSDAMAEIDINKLPEILQDKKLSESELKTVYNLNVIMVKRDDLPIKVTKDTVIKENDNIVIFGNYDSIKKVFLN